MEPKIALTNENKLFIPDKSILEPGELGATIEWFVRDTITGEEKQHVGPKRSESFVSNFLSVLALMFNQSNDIDNPGVYATDNFLKHIGMSSYTFDVAAAINIATYGIQVGSGITAPTIANRFIETQIAHGVGAGQLQYGAVTFGAPASDATTSQFTVTRNFANGSGGAVVVNEITLVFRQYKGDVNTLPFYFMIIRDVIAGGINVLNGQTLTVNYRPQAVI